VTYFALHREFVSTEESHDYWYQDKCAEKERGDCPVIEREEHLEEGKLASSGAIIDGHDMFTGLCRCHVLYPTYKPARLISDKALGVVIPLSWYSFELDSNNKMYSFGSRNCPKCLEDKSDDYSIEQGIAVDDASTYLPPELITSQYICASLGPRLVPRANRLRPSPSGRFQ
jgi:hypothetical protein